MLGVPEELGGVMHEQAAVTSVLIGEALAHGDMGIAYAALAPGAVATAIGHWGTPEQEATYLPAFTGEDTPAAALAILEPRPLFDPLKLETTATKKGGDWVLERHQVAARPPQRLRALHRRRRGRGHRPGALRDRVRHLRAHGRGGAGDGAAPRRHRPPPARGRDAARRAPCSARASARTTSSACSAPASPGARSPSAPPQATLDYVKQYVNERIAFGEPISNRQGVAFAVSDIGIESEGMRLATYRAASRADQGQDFAREAAMARRLCAQKGMQIGSEGVQLLGGHGFVKEHPVERWYRDLRAAGVMEGALLV